MTEEHGGTAPAGAEAEVSAPAGNAGDTVDQPADVAPANLGGSVDAAAGTTIEGAASPGQEAGSGQEAEAGSPGVVIRDRRKVRDPAKADPVQTDLVDADPVQTDPVQTDPIDADPVEVTAKADPVPTAPAQEKPAEPAPTEQMPAEPAIAAERPAGEPIPAPLGAELESLRRSVDELTQDLQRMTAEYANYRKRVERDKGLVGEHAMGTVLVSLLPVLDDIDRAREHGDLVGPFGSVAEQLVNALTKFGLTPFGEKGDTFDPTRHEAVAHQTSSEVTESTCVDILRRGYLLGERLLRPALVAVADPE